MAVFMAARLLPGLDSQVKRYIDVSYEHNIRHGKERGYINDFSQARSRATRGLGDRNSRRFAETVGCYIIVAYRHSRSDNRNMGRIQCLH